MNLMLLFLFGSLGIGLFARPGLARREPVLIIAFAVIVMALYFVFPTRFM